MNLVTFIPPFPGLAEVNECKRLISTVSSEAADGGLLYPSLWFLVYFLFGGKFCFRCATFFFIVGQGNGIVQNVGTGEGRPAFFLAITGDLT
jgi:hypothetical protein